jgi:OFA family oxalate/formate antiporter-like MFS transporter
LSGNHAQYVGSTPFTNVSKKRALQPQILLASQGLWSPPAADSAGSAVSQTAVATRDYRPSEMLKTPLFWLMFAMMTMMSTSGLMVTSQMASFAADFGVSKILVFGLAALPLALTIDRFTNV